MYESDIRRTIKQINSKLTILKSYSDDDPNPFGYGTVKDAKADLRYRKKEFQQKLKEKEAEQAYDRARSKALYRIFDRENQCIYPSDIGQDWSWRTENDTVYCVIEGKEFSEPIILEKK